MEPDSPANKSADLPRTLRIDVRVSPEEKKELQAKAKAAGYQKVSAYLRDVGRGMQVKECIPPELRRQLVRIGTDLNRLASLAQASQPLTGYEAELQQALTIIRSYLV